VEATAQVRTQVVERPIVLMGRPKVRQKATRYCGSMKVVSFV